MGFLFFAVGDMLQSVPKIWSFRLFSFIIDDLG